MTDATTNAAPAPSLAEDVLLVLFDAASGSIFSEESPLFHLLTGAIARC